MTDMQVAIGLRRETSDDLGVLAGVQVGLDDGAQKVGGFFDGRLAHGVLNGGVARLGRPLLTRRAEAQRIATGAQGRPTYTKRLS